MPGGRCNILADPSKARGYSTNTVVNYSFTDLVFLPMLYCVGRPKLLEMELPVKK